MLRTKRGESKYFTRAAQELEAMAALERAEARIAEAQHTAQAKGERAHAALAATCAKASQVESPQVGLVPPKIGLMLVMRATIPETQVHRETPLFKR